MAQRASSDRKTTALAFQGGGAIGAYALGVLRHIYGAEPDFRPSCVSGVSIGAFTAAIVASAPDDPITPLEAFWDDLAIDLPFVPPVTERRLSAFGVPAFYRPRIDYFRFPFWTSFYELAPLRKTLEKYVDLERIARADVKLAVTATDIESGAIRSFTNTDPDNPLTLEHIIASGSLPPGFPWTTIEGRQYWDGGLFDNTPLSALLDLVDDADAARTRVIVVNLYPRRGHIPDTMFDVADRMIELQFANKTEKDVALARRINKLVIAIEALTQNLPIEKRKIFEDAEMAELARFRIFENIVLITNEHPEPVSSSSDFSRSSIDQRIDNGMADAERVLNAPPPDAATLARSFAALM